MPRGRNASSTPHLKSMGTYELHAQRDAMAIAALLDQMIGAEPARKLYASVDIDALRKYERKMESAIADFIGRGESQRPSVVRKLPDATTRVGFLTLAILGCVRAGKVLEIRDQYRDMLAPGRGNRQTAQAMYEFSLLVEDTFSYVWPWEVFEEAGLDDGWQEDEDGDGGEAVAGQEATTPWRPTPPPPPPPVAPPRNVEEILVAMGPADSVLSTAGSDQKAWTLSAVGPRGGYANVSLYKRQLSDEALLDILHKFSDQVVGDRPAFLVFTPRHKAFVDQLNAHAGREIAGLTRKGVSSMACYKWPAEILRSLERELQLVGEAMVTAGECEQIEAKLGQGKLFTTRHADERDSWWEQREDLEVWTKAILEERGRWLGQTAGLQNRRSSGNVRSRDLGKARRTVRNLQDSVDLTAFGDALLVTASAILGWRDGELPFNEAARMAAIAALEYFFRRPAQADYNLQLELEPLFGRGSAEMAMLDAGLARLLAGPFFAGMDLREHEERKSRLGFMNRAIKSSRAWHLAWWCVVELPAPENLRQANWVLTQTALEEAISNNIGHSGAIVRMGAELFPLQLEPSGTNSSWNTEAAVACGSARALIDWIAGRTPSFKSYGRWEMRQGGTRWGFPVLARADSADMVVAARGAWEQSVAEAIQARLYKRDVDGRSKRAMPPPGVRVLSKTADFLEPDAGINEQIALFTGRRWDAQAGLAL